MRVKQIGLVLILSLMPHANGMSDHSFHVRETSVTDIHQAIQAGILTCHGLVQQYLDRIQAYDQQGPAIRTMNCLAG